MAAACDAALLLGDVEGLWELQPHCSEVFVVLIVLETAPLDSEVLEGL